MIRRWLPDAAAGTIVLALGGVDILFYTEVPLYSVSVLLLLLVTLGTAVATSLSRLMPGPALLFIWLIVICQARTGTPVVLAQVATAAVIFGAARWGRPETLWFGLLSLPLGAGFAMSVLNGSLLASVLGMTILGTSWLGGVVLRVTGQARAQSLAAENSLARVQAEREQARELARMQEENARLARDVHDVVGHSLAVILAQAEAGQYLPDGDPGALKETLATIATSARTSLRDVRRVLSTTRDRDGPDSDDLDELIEGVRRSGHEVVSTHLGNARPLPPEQAATAFRTLQEMLTNAMKYGRRGVAVAVLRHWTDGDREAVLVIEVRNQVDTDRTEETASAGQGLTGMRQRLAAVGGRLDVRRETDVFAVTAWIPVRS